MAGWEDGSDLSRRVEQLRRRLSRSGVNLSKVADLAGVSRPTIYNLRDGTKVLLPREGTVAAVERALGEAEGRVGGSDASLAAARVDSELRRLASLKTSARTLASSLIRNPTVTQDLELMAGQVVEQMERMV